MGFYLEGKYISDEYLRYELLGTNKPNGDMTVVLNEEIDKIIMEKLNVIPKNITMEDLINAFFNNLDKNSTEDLSTILNFSRPHILSILYLNYEKRIGMEDISRLISSTSLANRTELLLSFLNDTSKNTDEIDIFEPLKNYIKKLSNCKNPGELKTIGKNLNNFIKNLNNDISPLDYNFYSINYGNYYYERVSNPNGILKFCDMWDMNIAMPSVGVAEFLKDKSSNYHLKSDFLNIYNVPSADISATIAYTRDSILKQETREYYGWDVIKYVKDSDAAQRISYLWGALLSDFYNKFTKSKTTIRIDKVEENAIGGTIEKFLDKNFKIRTSQIRDLNNNEVENLVRSTFKSYFNQSITDIQGLDEKKKNKTYDDKYQVYNIYSLIDTIVNPNHKKVALLNRPVNENDIDIEGVLDNNCISGKRIGLDESGYIETLDVDYSLGALYEDIPAHQLKISNFISRITGIEYIVDGNRVKRKDLGLRLNNSDFLKNIMRHKDFDFAFNELKVDNLSELISKSETIDKFRSHLDSLREQSKGLGNNVYKDALLFNLDPSFLTMDYLIDDYGDNGSGKFINFGFTGFLESIDRLLKGVNSKFTVEDIYVNAVPIITNLKNKIDKMESPVIEVQNNSTVFIDHYALNIIKKYLDYLLNDNIEPNVFDTVLEVDEFEYKIYKIMYFVRHGALCFPDMRRKVMEDSLMKQFKSDNPFNDNNTIDSMYKLFIEVAKANSFVSSLVKSFSITAGKINNLKVGKVNAYDLFFGGTK